MENGTKNGFGIWPSPRVTSIKEIGCSIDSVEKEPINIVSAPTEASFPTFFSKGKEKKYFQMATNIYEG